MVEIPLSFVTGTDGRVVEGEKTVVYYVTHELEVASFESTVDRDCWERLAARHEELKVPYRARAYPSREAAEAALAKEGKEKMAALAVLVNSLSQVASKHQVA